SLLSWAAVPHVLAVMQIVLAASSIWTKFFAVVQVLLSIAMIGLILMHSGRDTGFGGMGFTPASQGGTHIVERKLTRLTVVVVLLFLANTIALFHQLK